jgi:REP element-mobilizing transposase RayT
VRTDFAKSDVRSSAKPCGEVGGTWWRVRGNVASMPTMPMRQRMRRRELPGNVRFITFSCFRRLPLLGHPGIRDLFVEAMAEAKVAHGFELFAWVVMPEHAHLVVRPREGRLLAKALASIKISMAKQVVRRWTRMAAVSRAHHNGAGPAPLLAEGRRV